MSAISTCMELISWMRVEYLSYQFSSNWTKEMIMAIGWMDARLITVGFVQRGVETIRIISARLASRSDEHIYEQNVGFGLRG